MKQESFSTYINRAMVKGLVKVGGLAYKVLLKVLVLLSDLPGCMVLISFIVGEGLGILL